MEFELGLLGENKQFDIALCISNWTLDIFWRLLSLWDCVYFRGNGTKVQRGRAMLRRSKQDREKSSKWQAPRLEVNNI